MNVKPPFLIAMIGVAVTGLIGYNFVHVPQQRQVLRIQGELAAEQTRHQTAASVADALQRVEAYRQRLPDKPDPSWLARQLVALAEQSGVQLSTIQRELPHQTEQFTQLSVKIHIAGTYHQLGTFLDQIERAPVFIRVDNAEIARAGSDVNSKDLASIALTLSTFYLPTMATAGGGATP